jgi:hypothetical protein
MVLPRHEWLPDPDRHLAAVRCIDCHTRMTDSVLVAHEVMAADSAVNSCVDCHSQNSILMGTLYKYASKESRDQEGFINGVIFSNDSYVIGANRSKFIIPYRNHSHFACSDLRRSPYNFQNYNQACKKVL